MKPRDIALLLKNVGEDEISSMVKDLARRHDIVIISGLSDDLIEFDGAIDQEVSAFKGKTVGVSRRGDVFVVPERAEDFAVRHTTPFAEIHGRWCVEKGYGWTFDTELPHESFEMGGPLPGRRIVFALSDIAAA
jgi:hypothetical protein